MIAQSSTESKALLKSIKARASHTFLEES